MCAGGGRAVLWCLCGGGDVRGGSVGDRVVEEKDGVIMRCWCISS